MDWFAPDLFEDFGLHALSHLNEILSCDVLDMPPETFKSPHLPLVKIPGWVLNVCTRPVWIESGAHRMRQRVSFRRIQHVTTPSLFGEAQFAIVKGVAPTQWRRFLYNIFLQRILAKEPVVGLMLDNRMHTARQTCAR